VLGPLALEYFGDLGPPLAFSEDGLQQQDILGDAPLVLLDLRVEVVDPLLAALLRDLEELALGPREQLERYLRPFVLCWLLPESSLPYLIMLSKRLISRSVHLDLRMVASLDSTRRL